MSEHPPSEQLAEVKVSFPSKHSIVPVAPPRPLNRAERDLLHFLLEAPFEGRDALRSQVDGARVAEECKTCPTVTLGVDPALARASTPARVPVEAESVCRWGAEAIHVLLHVADGYLAEIELFRFDHGHIGQMPRPDELRLTLPPAC